MPDTVRSASAVLFEGLLLAVFTAAMLSIGGASITAPAVAALLYGGTVVAASGVALASYTFGTRAPAGLALDIVLGSAATSVFLMGGCLLTGVRASFVFGWWSVLVAAAAVAGLRATAPAKRIDRREVVCVVVLGILVAFWCHRVAGALPTLYATGVAPTWTDYFIHGTEIAQFGDPLAVGHASFLLANQPIVFYHYAPYMLPAAVAGFVDLPAFGLAASVLVPYGILLNSLGAFALARTLGVGPGIALLVPCALLLLPDAARLGLAHGFYGIHWLLFTAPGSGYGLGVALAALAAFATWRTERSTACFWLGLSLTATLFLFRAHLFVLFVPAVVLTLVSEMTFARRSPRPLLLAILACALATLTSIAPVLAARGAWLPFSVLGPFVESAHTAYAPTAYDGVYRTIEGYCGRACAMTIGFWALAPAVLGVLTIALPVAMTAAVRRIGWRPLDSFPIWCLAAWLGLVLIAPGTAHGDITEYIHRPFVLVYTAAFVWTFVFVDRIQRATGPWPIPLRRAAMALTAASLVAATVANRREDPARPRFEWGNQYFRPQVERGLLDAAAFVHARSVPGDTFVLLPAEPEHRLDDAATRFAALADLPAYLARAGIQALNGRDRQAAVVQRLAQLGEIEAANDPDAAFLALRKIGVTFLVVRGPSGPRFDPDRSRAAFRGKDVAVYQITAARQSAR
jgi:hypothetical protein